MSDYQGNIVIKNPATPTGPSTYGRAPGMWKLSEVAYWIKQGVWPNPAIVPDLNFPNVSLLLSTTALGNANNNLFVDSSGAFNPMSRNGNTTQGSFTPYSTNLSNYFAGAGSYLQTPANSATTIVGTLSSTANLTIECWIFPTAYNSSANFPGLIGDMVATSENNNWSWGITNTGTLMLYWNISGTQYRAYTTSTVSLNAWTHIALNVAAGAITMYINGVSQSLTGTTTLGTPSGSNNYLVIGQWNNGSGGTGGTSNGLYTGYISNLRVVKASTYTSNFTVPTAPLSAITSTSLLTCQSNRFRDASTNNLTLTVAGSMAVNDFGPFSPPVGTGYVYNQSDITNWSGYFDGSGDYLSVPDNAALNMAGSTFTLECWIYPNGNYSDYRTIMSKRNASTTSYQMFLFQTTGYLSFSRANTAYQSSATPTANAWNHVAAVYDGTNINLYLNGTRVLQTAVSIADTADPLLIGAIYTGGENFNGYISNARVLKGVQAYSGATITVPTTPLTAISGTSLLTLQNAAFTDNSTNNFVITPFGNTTVTGNSPFNTVGYWSNYFDASGDYQRISSSQVALQFGTGDFTVEGWVYSTGATGSFQHILTGGTSWTSGSGGIYWYYNGGSPYIGAAWNQIATNPAVNSATLAINTWYHFAVVRSGNTLSLYVNGTSVDTLDVTGVSIAVNNQSQTNIGGGGWDSDFGGYLSNLRVVKGTAVYTSNFTVPTTPLTAITNTSLLVCQSSRFIDSSTNAFTLVPAGNVAIQSFDPFYTATIASNGGSLYLDGAGDYLTSPTSPAYNFGSSNFTIEGWFYFTNSTANALQTLYTNYTSFSSAGSIFFGKHTNNSGYVTVWFSSYSTGGPLLAETTYPPNNAWTHYALVRNGNTFTLYRNGVSTASASWSGAATSGSNAIWVGAAGDAVTAYNFPGYISDFRITKSAVYTAAFTPPTAPLTPSANTTLLLNGMNAGIYDATTINDMETVGNAQVRYPSPYAPADYYAGAFDGSGDYISAGSNAAFAFGTGAYTTEAWVYITGSNSLNNLFCNDTTNGFDLYFNYSSNTTLLEFRGGSNVITFNAIPTRNTWTHVALVREGTGSNQTKLYFNGVLQGSGTDATNWTVTGPMLIGAIAAGADLSGSISNARIVKGTAVYTSNFTPSTTPLTAISGTSLLTCQNKTFIDNSTNAFTITAFGNATAGAIGPFTATGGTSMYFGGLNNWLDFPANPTADFGTGDITIECWLYVTSTATSYQSICQFGNAAVTSGFHILTNNNTICLRTNNSQPLTTSGTFTANTWNHIALTRASGTTRIFINGTTSGGTYNWTASLSSGSTRRIGGDIYSNALTGYIDDFRVTRGVARYTSNFTPPTQAFPTY